MGSGFCGVDTPPCLRPMVTVLTFKDGQRPLPLCDYHVTAFQERMREAGFGELDIQTLRNVTLAENNRRDAFKSQK